MKKITVLVLLLTSAGFLSAQDAVSIMNSVKNRIQSDTMISRSRMVITAKNGTTAERAIDQCSKDGPNGGRTVIVFLSPASVAGTRFLTMDNVTGGSDQWIFLPEVKKVRRIAASQSGGSFMGTDFSYGDISLIDRDVSLDTHSLLREEILNGNSCYVVQSVPKNSSWQYSKTIAWIDKTRYLTYKSEMYNRRGELIKVMEMSNYKDVQGRLTPMQTKISTVGSGTSTTIYIENLKYDAQVSEGYFTMAYLETGKAQ
jgi:hypothetical protein